MLNMKKPLNRGFFLFIYFIKNIIIEALNFQEIHNKIYYRIKNNCCKKNIPIDSSPEYINRAKVIPHNFAGYVANNNNTKIKDK